MPRVLLLLMCCSLVVFLCYIVAGIVISTSIESSVMPARGVRNESSCFGDPCGPDWSGAHESRARLRVG